MIYQSEFASLNGTNYKVEISTPTGSGTKTFTLGGSPFVTSMDSDGKTIYAPIKSTGATLEMVTDGLPFDLYSGQTTQIKVTLTNTTANKVEWVGFVTPCAYDMGFDEERETIEIECVDGLAALKDMPYRSTNKDVDTFLNVVFKCLKRVGCFKNLYVTDNIQMTANGTESIMSKLRISEANFFDSKDSESQPDDSVAWNCYDVLFEIMQYMGYTITAVGEDVYILDYDAMVKGRTKFFKYSLTGSSIGSPSNVTISHSHHITGTSYAENGTKVSLDEVYNQVTVVDDFTEIESLVDGLNDSKNLTNITADTDAYLKQWFNTDSRFLESEVFTVKNGKGEDESFFITLTKNWKGRIYFVYGKFYKNALLTTYHYANRPNNGLESESGFSSMRYSRLWDSKGAWDVGYYVAPVESKDYNIWRANITSNWDGQTKEKKLEQFGKLVNVANLPAKKLTNYILCLNGDTNHIDHDKVKNYPFFTVKKSIPAIFGGDGGYLIIQGTLIRHDEPNTPFPMQAKDSVSHGNTSIYANEAYFWARLKWGNKYWKCEDGDYNATGEWVTTPSYFKIYYGNPTKEQKAGDFFDKDLPFYNTSNAIWGINDENGYYIPVPSDGNLTGEVEFTVYCNKDTKGRKQKGTGAWDWASKDKKNSYDTYRPKVVLFKGLDIKCGYADDALNDDAASADTYYAADNSTSDNVLPMDEVKFKICTFDNKIPSYSTVDYIDTSGKSQYLDETYNLATGRKLRQEHHLVYKLVCQYQDPRVVFEANLKNSLDIRPWSVLTDLTLSNRKFIPQTIERDYKQNTATVELIEKNDKYDAVN